MKNEKESVKRKENTENTKGAEKMKELRILGECDKKPVIVSGKSGCGNCG